MDNPPPPITEQIYDEQAIIAKASLDDRAKIEKKIRDNAEDEAFLQSIGRGLLAKLLPQAKAVWGDNTWRRIKMAVKDQTLRIWGIVDGKPDSEIKSDWLDHVMFDRIELGSLLFIVGVVGCPRYAERLTVDLREWNELVGDRPSDLPAFSAGEAPQGEALPAIAEASSTSPDHGAAAVPVCDNAPMISDMSETQDTDEKPRGRGAPSKTKEIEAEFGRRLQENTCKPTLAGEARALLQWSRRVHPKALQPKQSTV